jgi:hypothetical protein
MSLTFLILHILTRIFLHSTYILPVYMSAGLFVFLCLSVLSVILSVCLYVSLVCAECLKIRNSVHLSVCLSAFFYFCTGCLSICLCMSLFLFVCMCAADAAFWSCTAVSSRSKMATFPSKACTAAKGTNTPDVK